MLDISIHHADNTSKSISLLCNTIVGPHLEYSSIILYPYFKIHCSHRSTLPASKLSPHLPGCSACKHPEIRRVANCRCSVSSSNTFPPNRARPWSRRLHRPIERTSLLETAATAFAAPGKDRDLHVQFSATWRNERTCATLRRLGWHRVRVQKVLRISSVIGRPISRRRSAIALLAFPRVCEYARRYKAPLITIITRR